jgi:hypothetical protein
MMTKIHGFSINNRDQFLQSASHPEQAWLIGKRSKSNAIVVVVQGQLQHMSVE